jgi:putative chitinase
MPDLTPALLHTIYPHATLARVALYLPHLLIGMTARAIDTPLRQAHFLAQVGHESGELRYHEELASGNAYEGRADLGNTEQGDGKRFKGRGLIQLTGRANYQAYGKAIGRDLTHDGHWAEVATEPALAVDVACWFWERHHLNRWADLDDITTITRRVNGGLNGLASRQVLLKRAKEALGV